MSRTDRRTVLRLAALSLVPALALRPAAARSAPHFAPPDGPMLYVRRVRRGMPGGASFLIERSFAVRFIGQEQGFRLEGEQVGVTVEAPDQLAEFAKIERARRETALFPLTLDLQGRIFGAAPPVDASYLGALVREATVQIERSAVPADARAELLRFVSALHQSTSKLVSELPQDLFAPAQPERLTVRQVTLPGGEQGEVTVRFTALADLSTGVMRQAEREVVTELEGDSRSTLETWRLTPA